MQASPFHSFLPLPLEKYPLPCLHDDIWWQRGQREAAATYVPDAHQSCRAIKEAPPWEHIHILLYADTHTHMYAYIHTVAGLYLLGKGGWGAGRKDEGTQRWPTAVRNDWQICLTSVTIWPAAVGRGRVDFWLKPQRDAEVMMFKRSCCFLLPIIPSFSCYWCLVAISTLDSLAPTWSFSVSMTADKLLTTKLFYSLSSCLKQRGTPSSHDWLRSCYSYTCFFFIAN
jgi:hypothetical protein